MSSPLFDEGPPVQVHEPPPDAEAELVDVDEAVDDVLRLEVDVVATMVLLELVARLEVVLLDVVARLEVVLLLAAPPPPLADAEVTVAGVGAPALAAQKPNDVDCPAAIVEFHASGVTVSVPPETPKFALHPLLSEELPIESVTVHDVTAAVPPLATTTFSQ